jgi:hypothetical protein
MNESYMVVMNQEEIEDFVLKKVYFIMYIY